MTTDARWAEVRQVLEDGVAARAFPGAAVLIGRGDSVLAEMHVGDLEQDGAQVSQATIYDLSSLTKPLATQAALLVLAARGELGLDDPLVGLYPEFADTGPLGERGRRELVTISDVLAHRAGLQAVAELWRRLEDEFPDQVGGAAAAQTIAGYAAQVPLGYEPRTGTVYSDLGFIMLGVALERLCGVSLESFVTTEVIAPLGAAVGYRPVPEQGALSDESLVAPCGDCSWRGGIVRGVVQDENAWAMGGVAGHAGLFGSARGVHTLVAEYVAASLGRGRLLSTELVRRCWQPEPRVSPPPPGGAASTWVFGWDTPTPGRSSAGRFISPGSVGHLGFTGTSVWLDHVRGVHVILLTNRLHPDRENIAIRGLRPKVHDAAFLAVDGGITSATAGT